MDTPTRRARQTTTKRHNVTPEIMSIYTFVMLIHLRAPIMDLVI